MNATIPAITPEVRKDRGLLTMLMLALSVALSAAALTVALIHAGPAGTPGRPGLTGSQGPAGPQGPAGTSAPTLGYQCQMLFPDNTNRGTETTFYWPCSDSSMNG